MKSNTLGETKDWKICYSQKREIPPPPNPCLSPQKKVCVSHLGLSVKKQSQEFLRMGFICMHLYFEYTMSGKLQSKTSNEKGSGLTVSVLTCKEFGSYC